VFSLPLNILLNPSIYLYLLNDADSVSDHIASNDRMVNDNELEIIWKEAGVVKLKTISRNLPGGTEP
jgi:hypothetical protein